MSLRKIIRENFGASSMLYNDEVSDKYTSDWTGGGKHRPEVVLRPKTVEHVSSMLKLCNAAGQKIVIQGGLTGLSGGASPKPGEWSLSLERMNKIIEIDQDALTITVQAGAPLSKVQLAAEDAGLYFPLDLGARGSCQIGGNIATNAGGNQVIKYGMARALVSGMVAVLADGTILANRNKLLKNNAGYDLKQLFIGSEGTLGIITEVVLRLFPKPLTKQSAMCALESMTDVISLLKAARSRLPSISAFEVMWPNYFDACISAVDDARSPFTKKYSYYVILESEGHYADTDFEHFCALLSDLMEQGIVANAVLAQSIADAENFWKIRDGIGELTALLKNAAHFDIGIPIRSVEACVDDIQSTLLRKFPSVIAYYFGHLGDGNFHIVAGTENEEQKYGVYNAVYEITGKYEGSITAEHGVGSDKTQWLHHSRDEAEIALMRALKATLDPKGILNPGRVF
jgi:FAD/FMN-containing dehydrogenase